MQPFEFSKTRIPFATTGVADCDDGVAKLQSFRFPDRSRCGTGEFRYNNDAQVVFDVSLGWESLPLRFCATSLYRLRAAYDVTSGEQPSRCDEHCRAISHLAI